MLKNPSKKLPRSRSRSGWLPSFNQFFLVHRYISCKISTKIQSVAFIWSC